MPEETSPPSEELLGLDVMSASVLPIYTDVTNRTDSKATLQAIQKVYEAGQGRWSPEAEEAFAEDIAALNRTYRMHYDMTPLRDYGAPPEHDPNKSELDNLNAVDEWQKSTVEAVKANASPGDWLLTREQVEETVDNEARATKQQITGATTGWTRDKIGRGLNAGLAVAASAIPYASETLQKDAGDYFDMNPKYNEDTSSRYAEAIGQGGIQMAVPLAAGITTGLMFTPPVGIATTALLGGFINGSAAWHETYKNVYDETGSEDSAVHAATERGFSETALELGGEAVIGLKLIGPWYRGLSKAAKATALSQVIKENGKFAWKKALVEGAATGAGSEFVTEAAQSLAQQAIEQPYTDKDIDVGQAVQEGKYGAAAGFLFGGAGNVLTHYKKYSSDKIAAGLIDAAEKKKVLKENGTIGNEDGDTGDFGPPGGVDTLAPHINAATTKKKQAAAKKKQAAAAAANPEDPSPPPRDLAPVGDVTVEEVSRTNNAVATDALFTNAANIKTEITNAVEALNRARAGNKAPVSSSVTEPEMASKTEAFANDPLQDTLHLPGIIRESVPENMLDVLSKGHRFILRTKQEADGVTIVKTPILQDTVQAKSEAVETSYTVSPNAEEERRLATYPNKISQLKAKLARVPTKTGLVAKINDLSKMIAASTKAFNSTWTLADPKHRQLQQDTITKNVNTLKSMHLEAIQQFRNFDLITDEKARIEDDIKELQLKYDLARDFISSPHQSLDVAQFESPKKLQDISEFIKSHTPEEVQAHYAELNAATQSGEEVNEEAVKNKEDFKAVLNFLKTNPHSHIDNILAVHNERKPAYTKEKAEPGAKKTAAKSTAKPTAEQVKASPATYIVQSRSTGVVYTKSIANSLRNSINYWLGGFGVRNVVVLTEEDFLSGTYNGLFSEELQKLIKEVEADKKREFTDKKVVVTAGGVFHANKEGTQGIMILKDGSYNVDSHIKAAHEVGHALQKMLMNNLPEDVKAQMLKEYTDAVKDIKSKLKTGEIKSVKDVADAMMGIRSSKSPFNATTSFARMSAKDKGYIIGVESGQAGYSEWQANRILKFVHRPEMLAGTVVEKIYKGIADTLRKLWTEVAGRFKDAPTIDSFLEEHWSEQRANAMFYPGATKETRSGEPNYKKSVRKAQLTAAIKNALPGAYISKIVQRLNAKEPIKYIQQNHLPILRKAENAIQAKDGANFPDILESWLKDDGSIPESERGLWGAQIVTELNRLENAAESKADKKNLAEKQNEVWLKIREEGRVAGQLTESMKLFHAFTVVGRANHIYTELVAKSSSRANAPRWEYPKIYNAVNHYFEAEMNAPTGSIKNAISKLQFEKFNKDHGNPSSSDATWNYWYGNILSGIATQYANVQFSALDTIGKTITNAILHPTRIGDLITGITRGMGLGGIEAKGALRGKLLRHVDESRIAGIVRNTAHVNWSNNWYSALAKPVNLILKMQQYYPFRFLMTSDMFWRRLGTEMQIQLAATEAVIAQLDSLKNTTLKETQKAYAVAVNDLDIAKEAVATAIKKKTGIREAKSNEQLAEATLKDAERTLFVHEKASEGIATVVSETLYNSTESWTAAKEQAVKDWASTEEAYNKKQELLKKDADIKGEKFEIIPFPLTQTENDINIRALEIIDEQRKEMQPDVYLEGERAGAWANLTVEPEGVAGILATALKSVVKDMPSAKLLFPFINVTANITTRGLDYTPVGVLRGLRKHNILAPKVVMETVTDPETGLDMVDAFGKPVQVKKTLNWSSLESRQRLVTGLMGSSMLVTLMATAMGSIDDKDPSFAVYASGPKDKGAREQLLAEGWMPYSIKVGGTFVKYAETPLAFLLGWFGSYCDAARWDKSFNRKKPTAQFIAAAGLSARVVADMGVLKSVKDMMDVVYGTRSASGTALSMAKGLVPYKGLLGSIAQLTDPDKTDPTSATAIMLSGLPWIQSYGGAQKDLNAFGEPLDRTPRFYSWSNAQKGWEFLAKNDLHIPGMSNTIVVEEGDGKEKAFFSAVHKDRERALGRMAHDVLTSDEAYRLQLLSGAEIKKGIMAIAREGTVKNPEAYQKHIDKLVADARHRAKLKILRENYGKSDF